MDTHPVRILFETSPERLEALTKRVMAFAVYSRLHRSGGRMYLEVAVRDDIFGSGTADTSGTSEKKPVPVPGEVPEAGTAISVYP